VLKQPRGTYTEWFWPTAPDGFTAFEHVLTTETDPGPRSSFFWAHQFQLVGGDGGYLGLQTRGDRGDGTWEKIAIFSIWEALEADGRATYNFDGEGVGWSCHIPYPWVAGRAYRLRVQTDEPGWWDASVVDEESGVVARIGRIRVGPACRGLGQWSVMWTEYYGGPIRACSDLPHSSVIFSTPSADDGSVGPLSSRDRVGDGSCETSAIEAVAPDGVRHQMGIPG